MIMEKVIVVTNAICLEHCPHEGHPETPRRLEILMEMVEDMGLPVFSGRSATVEEIGLVHTKKYVDFIMSQNGKTTALDPDTYLSPNSVTAAFWAVGCTLSSVEKVINGECSRAFSLIRPPGHHAEPDRAMGFCIFNNVSISARYAQRLGIGKVAIIDFDVHHGNGTQRAFYDDPTVLYISTHQFPYYPGTGSKSEIGEGKGKGYTLNIPLPPGQDDETFVSIYKDIVRPTIEKFSPDFILVSAGFDIHVLDPLGGMNVTYDGFQRIASILVDVANVTSKGRLVMVLEGGYNEQGLKEGVKACLTAMAK